MCRLMSMVTEVPLVVWSWRVFVVTVMLGVNVMAIGVPRVERTVNLKPDEVLVLANRSSKESLKVARYYMKRRGIPKKNLFTIEYKDYGQQDPTDLNPKWMPFDEYQTSVVAPLEEFLTKSGLRDTILCFVTVYDMPYRVGGFTLSAAEDAGLCDALAKEPAYRAATPEEQKKLLQARVVSLWGANSAFDSELAWRFASSPPGESAFDRRLRLQKSAPNPYFRLDTPFREFRQQQCAANTPERLYLVSRLDGQSAAMAMGLVDKAREAESKGVSGTAYFDANGPGADTKGYNQGDWWIRRAYEITKEAGIPVKYETSSKQFGEGECPDALIYWGWYRSFDYQGAAFNHKFPVGAIACHIASFEAANIHHYGRYEPNLYDPDPKNNGPWCSGFLHDGVTVTIGPVGEPYLTAFPHTEYFFPHLYGGWSVGEAYWSSIPHTSWNMILVGDPLYAPFAAQTRRL